MLLNTSRQHISKRQTLQNSTKLSILVSDNIRAAHVKMAHAIKYSIFFFFETPTLSKQAAAHDQCFVVL